MIVLRNLSKQEIITLLEIANACCKCEDLTEFQTYLDKFRWLIHFDCVAGTLVDLDAAAVNPSQAVKTVEYKVPHGLMNEYWAQCYWRKDFVLNQCFETLKIQNIMEGVCQCYGNHPNEVVELFRSYNIWDGWLHPALQHRHKRLTLFAFMSEHIENSLRDQSVIKVTVPFFIQAFNRIMEPATPAQTQLTPREVEVLNWVKEGKTSWEISLILSISKSCVNFHIENAKRKLDVVNRTQAVAAAVSQGIIQI